MLSIVRALLTGLVAIAPALVIRVLTAIGVGAATYTGVKALLDQVKSVVVTQVSGLGSDILVYVGVFNLDRYITIVFSAYLVKLLFAGMNAAGVMSKMQWKPPTVGS